MNATLGVTLKGMEAVPVISMRIVRRWEGNESKPNGISPRSQ